MNVFTVVLLPLGMIYFGYLTRQRAMKDPFRRSADERVLGTLAMFLGAGWLVIGLVRIATGS